MSIKHLAYRLFYESKAGVAGLADFMGMSKQVLINKLNPNSTSHHLNIQELEMSADFIGEEANLLLAGFFAEKAKAVVIQMPDVALGDMGLLDGFMEVVKDLGVLTKDFQDSWADGRITKKEFNQLKKDGLDVQAQVSLLLAMIQKLSEEEE